jgi:hypothetical protein
MVSPSLHARLDELSMLGEDWDSYGGLPPTTQAFAVARRFLAESAATTDQQPAAILPFPNGGLQIIWEDGDCELQVDIGPDGVLGYLMIRRGPVTPEMSEAEDVPFAEMLRLVGCIGR